MARSANSRRGRTGVSSKAGGTHHDRPRERQPQMPHLTFIKEDSVSLPTFVPYGLARISIVSDFAEVQ